MADVSDKIVGQFSSCLANKLGPQAESSGGGEAAASSGSGASAGSGATAADQAPKSAASSDSPAPAPSAIKTAPTPAPSATSANGVAPKLASAPEPTRSEVDAIDLLDTAGAPVLKRLAPVVLGLLALFVVFRVIKGRRS
jgi:hypothetical protein